MEVGHLLYRWTSSCCFPQPRAFLCGPFENDVDHNSADYDDEPLVKVLVGDFLATMSIYIPYTHLPALALAHGIHVGLDVSVFNIPIIATSFF